MADYGDMFYGTLPEDTQDFRQVLAGIGRTLRDRAIAAGQRIGQSGQEAIALQNQIFGDPNRPLRVTDENALRRFTDMIMGGPLGFAPAGVTKAVASTGLLTQGTELLGPQAVSKTPLESIVDKAKSKKIDLQVAETENLIDLGFIKTPIRSKGLGTETMRDLINYADQTGKQIRLLPDASMAKNMDEGRLVKFYENLGFEKQKPVTAQSTSGFKKFAPTYWIYKPKE